MNENAREVVIRVQLEYPDGSQQDVVRRAGDRPADQPLLRTVRDAARLLSIGEHGVWDLIAHGEIDSMMIGRSRRIPHEALERFVERRLASTESGGADAA